jgi:hypothetical protein
MLPNLTHLHSDKQKQWGKQLQSVSFTSTHPLMCGDIAFVVVLLLIAAADL